MTEIVAGDAGRSTSNVQPPGPVSLALRPLGYLGLAVLWMTLWLIALAIPAGALVYLAVDDPDAVVDNLGRQFANPFTALATVALLIPLIAVIMGPGAIFHLPMMCWPLAVLSVVYAARALRPSYSREKLSFTTWQARGESLGPPTVGDLSLSLQPVRSTRLTDIVMRFYIAGWSLDMPMFVAMLPVGGAWSLLVGVVVPGFSTTVRIVCLVLAVLLTLASLVLGLRAFRRRFWGVDDGDGGESRPVSAMSAQARQARARALVRQRKARIRGHRP